MGSDAIVNIWVGIQSEDCEIHEVVDKFLRDFFDQEGSLVYREEDIMRVKKKYGCAVQKIYCCEELAGFGVLIFTHEWDFGAAKFDIAEIGGKRMSALLSLGKIFKDNGIDEGVNVWCQTDYR